MSNETISFELNGAPVSVAVGRDVPLLYVLRNDLDSRSVRFGCGDGLCGACRVIVEGKAVNSCDTLLWQVAGKSVRTVASQESDPRLGILVEELATAQAGQCGYCLPGITMSALALLESTPVPDRATIAAALSDNLCRCGAHHRILGAIETAGRRIGETA